MLNLSETELKTLKALMDRIIPADDYPAASAAGVPGYLQRIFETDLQSKLDWFQAGLASLNKESQIRFSTPFSELELSRQDSLIESILAGKCSTAWNGSACEYVLTMINLISEGYYADPGNGGNTDGVSWKMIGFDVNEGIRLPVVAG